MDAALDELRFHWGGAYVVEHPASDRWTARRRDNGALLKGETPNDLYAVLRRDYIRNPVPRPVS